MSDASKERPGGRPNSSEEGSFHGKQHVGGLSSLFGSSLADKEELCVTLGRAVGGKHPGHFVTCHPKTILLVELSREPYSESMHEPRSSLMSFMCV
jgi:hypothetical protein